MIFKKVYSETAKLFGLVIYEDDFRPIAIVDVHSFTFDIDDVIINYNVKECSCKDIEYILTENADEFIYEM